MAVSVRFEIEDLKIKARRLDVFFAVDDAVLRVLEKVAKEGKELCPVRYGVLKGTIHARRGEVNIKRGVKHMVVAGPMPSDAIDTGPANHYAIVVHENMDAKHKVGQSKYLETPLDRAAVWAGYQISKDVKEALARGR